MDLEHDARRVLDELDVLRHPSDLDLLIFFARHPRTLLSSDQLGAFSGYGVKDVAASLDLLLESGSRRGHRIPGMPCGCTCSPPPPGGGWLPALLQLGSTREGRLALIWALRRQSGPTTGPAPRVEGEDTTLCGPLPFRRRRDARRKPNVTPEGGPGELRKVGGHGGAR